VGRHCALGGFSRQDIGLEQEPLARTDIVVEPAEELDAPTFARLFDEMGALPTPTLVVLGYRHVFVGAVGVLLVAGLVKELPVRDRLVTLAANGVHWISLVAVEKLYVSATMVQPVRSMEDPGASTS
jgi:hypothetical protein